MRKAENISRNHLQSTKKLVTDREKPPVLETGKCVWISWRI